MIGVFFMCFWKLALFEKERFGIEVHDEDKHVCGKFNIMCVVCISRLLYLFYKYQCNYDVCIFGILFILVAVF